MDKRENLRNSNTTVETQRQTKLGHDILHLSEEVDDQEGTQEESHVTCLHS